MTRNFSGHAGAARALNVGVDRDLVLALRRRDPGAFDKVYRTYADRIWRLLVRLSGSAEKAEDLFQETWLAAARHAHALREGTVLIAWLCAIARNKFRNGVRAGAFETKKRSSFAWVQTPAAQPDDVADARLRMARVTDAFSRLPDVHREVLLLCTVEGLETAHVAHVLGIGVEAVRKRLSRARAELCALLGFTEGDEK